MSDEAAEGLLANMAYKNFIICLWPDGDHRCALGAQAAPGPGVGPLLVRLNSMMFHADVIYVFDTWLLPKGSGPAALPDVPQHGLRLELAGFLHCGNLQVILSSLSKLRNPEINAGGVHCSS